jgi:DNA-binding IclR family transcriptional regulator
VFAAWDTPEGVGRWLGHPDLSQREDEQERFRAALDAVRRRGYSVTVDTPERTELLAALEILAERPEDDAARTARDEAIREVLRTEYLPTSLDETHRVIQMSAPVVDQAGRVHVAIMLLGPSRDLSGAQVRTYADELVAAADRASRAVGGRHPAGGAA